ncbi:MAG: formate dehydrogenase accessory sulfurtransferase FdhD [Terracidiphilus sp.]
MKAPSSIGPSRSTHGSMLQATIERVTAQVSHQVEDSLAIEEPLEIQLTYGPSNARQTRSISVTMRTPGNDFDLAAGFLMTEGVIRDANDIELVAYAGDSVNEDAQSPQAMDVLKLGSRQNFVRVDLAAEVEVNLGSLQRNFYTTSSCGICGKASLLALRTVCPPRTTNNFRIEAQVLYLLPERLRASQGVFDRTGGLHCAGLFDSAGTLLELREDVGRHNAVDKLIGSEFLADRTPLRDHLLLLSGRASFELLQKALMGGLSMVAAVGAPSSLAVQVAKEFDITLVGFLREDHFNIYHGTGRINGYTSTSMGVGDEAED